MVRTHSEIARVAMSWRAVWSKGLEMKSDEDKALQGLGDKIAEVNETLKATAAYCVIHRKDEELKLEKRLKEYDRKIKSTGMGKVPHIPQQQEGDTSLRRARQCSPAAMVWKARGANFAVTRENSVLTAFSEILEADRRGMLHNNATKIRSDVLVQREWKEESNINKIKGENVERWRDTWRGNEVGAGIPILKKYVFVSEEEGKRDSLVVLTPTEGVNPKVRELRTDQRKEEWKKLSDMRERKKIVDSKKSEEKDELMWRCMRCEMLRGRFSRACLCGRPLNHIMAVMQSRGEWEKWEKAMREQYVPAAQSYFEGSDVTTLRNYLTAFDPKIVAEWKQAGVQASLYEYDEWRKRMILGYQPLNVILRFDEFVLKKINEYNIARAVATKRVPMMRIERLTEEIDNMSLFERLRRIEILEKNERAREERARMAEAVEPIVRPSVAREDATMRERAVLDENIREVPSADGRRNSSENDMYHAVRVLGAVGLRQFKGRTATRIYENAGAKSWIAYDESFLQNGIQQNLIPFLTLEEGWEPEKSDKLTKSYAATEYTYHYSGKDHKATVWPMPIELLARAIEKTQNLGRKFDFALVNYYPNGNSGLGWHADDETDIFAKFNHCLY